MDTVSAAAIHIVGLYVIVEEAAIAGLLDRMGRCQASLEQYLAAEMTHRQALSIRTKVLGPEHPNMLASMNNLAAALSGQGEYATAEAIHSLTLELSKSVLGKKHSNTLMSMNNIAI